MKINVVYNKEIDGWQDALSGLEVVLIQHKIEFKSFDINNMENFGEFTIIIGGDGTILKAARYYSKFKIPLLGINIGRLGFLSQAGANEIEKTISDIIGNRYFVEDRIMLEAGGLLALNDFVIKGCMPARTSKFYLEINGKSVCDYVADGLIVSTPTGSTAYGLSAGGPVLYPALDALVIVPICPHTLNVRPLVVPADEIIRVKTSDKLLSVAADGYEETGCVKEITIKASANKARLAFLNDAGFYSVLRNKLHWGISPEK